MKTMDVWGSFHDPIGRVGMADEARSGGTKISTSAWPMGGPGEAAVDA